MATKAARRQLRELRQRNRKRHWAVRLAESGAPQSARVWLLAGGLDDDLARRYASAFSRGVTPTEWATTEIKKGYHTRHTTTVEVKRYDRRTFVKRLHEFAPQSPQAAAAFARVAVTY